MQRYTSVSNIHSFQDVTCRYVYHPYIFDMHESKSWIWQYASYALSRLKGRFDAIAGEAARFRAADIIHQNVKPHLNKSQNNHKYSTIHMYSRVFTCVLLFKPLSSQTCQRNRNKMHSCSSLFSLTKSTFSLLVFSVFRLVLLFLFLSFLFLGQSLDLLTEHPALCCSENSISFQEPNGGAGMAAIVRCESCHVSMIHMHCDSHHFPPLFTVPPCASPFGPTLGKGADRVQGVHIQRPHLTTTKGGATNTQGRQRGARRDVVRTTRCESHPCNAATTHLSHFKSFKRLKTTQ